MAFFLFEAGSHFVGQANLESSASSSQVLRLQNVPSCQTAIFKGLFKTLVIGSVPGILPTQLTPTLCQTPLPGCNSNNYKLSLFHESIFTLSPMLLLLSKVLRWSNTQKLGFQFKY